MLAFYFYEGLRHDIKDALPSLPKPLKLLETVEAAVATGYAARGAGTREKHNLRIGVGKVNSSRILIPLSMSFITSMCKTSHLFDHIQVKIY